MSAFAIMHSSHIMVMKKCLAFTILIIIVIFIKGLENRGVIIHLRRTELNSPECFFGPNQVNQIHNNQLKILNKKCKKYSAKQLHFSLHFQKVPARATPGANAPLVNNISYIISFYAPPNFKSWIRPCISDETTASKLL